MARSRHGRSRGGASPADPGLPSWARRHLDEAGDDAAPVALSGHHRSGRDEPSRLRGWGVAIVSVAAAVGAVPLAITSLANDHSDDPLPKVDTYTAGSPAPLQSDGQGGPAARRTVPGVAPGAAGSDPATAGVLGAPPAGAPAVAAPPVVAAPVVPGRTVPAALVRATPTVTPTTPSKPTTPRSATPTTPTSTEESRSAPKPPPKAKPSTPSSKPPASKAPAAPAQKAPPKESGGLVSNTVRGVGNTLGDVTGSLGL